MCNKLIHKYFFLFFRLQHNYGDRFLYFYTGTLLWRPIFALVESQKKSSGSPTDCVILFVSVESKFLTAYQQSFSIDFFFTVLPFLFSFWRIQNEWGGCGNQASEGASKLQWYRWAGIFAEPHTFGDAGYGYR